MFFFNLFPTNDDDDDDDDNDDDDDDDDFDGTKGTFFIG